MPSAEQSLLEAPFAFQNKSTAIDDSWHGLWQQFMRLSNTQKNILIVISASLVLFIGFTPILLLLIVYYVAQPSKVKDHIRRLLLALNADPRL